MSSSLVLASLASLVVATSASGCSTTAAPPTSTAQVHRAPPSSTGCPATGDVVFEIDVQPDLMAPRPASTLQIYESGGWKFASHWAAKPPVPAPLAINGCFDLGALAKLKQALATATWKVTKADVICDGMANHTTEYRIGTKVVFSQRMCDARILDAASQRALDEALALVKPVLDVVAR